MCGRGNKGDESERSKWVSKLVLIIELVYFSYGRDTFPEVGVEICIVHPEARISCKGRGVLEFLEKS